MPVSMVAQKEGVVMRGPDFHSFLRRLYDRCEVMENAQGTTTKTVVSFFLFLLTNV